MSNEELGWEDSLGDIVSPGDVIADKYRVDRLIGTGGMGLVVQAWHVHFEERVAIKFLLPHKGANQEARERFEREARAAFKIKSEHVARVIDVGKLDGRVPYMVMEFLEGHDLGVMLSDRRGFPIHDSVEYVLQAIEAVAEAHTQGIVHRDLKPENLFLTRRADGSACVKVLDFGLSKVATSPMQRERALTATTQVMGTPQYMSPEQWMSAKDVGPAADQWALGVILYELVTGRQPFDEEHLAQLCTKVLRSQPDPVAKYRPDTPAGLETVILRCLRKDPADRYANVGELAMELHHYGPPRLRGSARRIAGVFSRAGVDVGVVPESVRGGLGAGMVLGAPVTPKPLPEKTMPVIAIAAPGPGATLPAASFPTARAAAPPVNLGQTSPHVETDEVEERAPSSSKTQVLPDRVAPTVQDPSTLQVSDSGNWHAAPVPAHNLPNPQDSGQYRAFGMPNDSGRFEALAHPSAQPQSQDFGQGIIGAPARPRRAGITAQSWQNIMTPPDEGRRKVAVVVFGAVLLVASVAALALVLPSHTESNTAAPASEGARDTVEAEARPDGDDTSTASDVATDDTQEAVADGAGGEQAEPHAGGQAGHVRRPTYPAGSRTPPKTAASAQPPPAAPPPGNPFRAKTKPGLPPEFYNSR